MPALAALAGALAALAGAAPAAAQLPPLPPVGGVPDPDPDPRPEPDPPPQQQPPAPGPVSPAPGSVTVGVDVAHTGHFPDDELVPPLVPRWSIAASATAIVAAAGRAFLAERALVAIDLASGRTIWRAALPASAEGAAYDDGIVFVSTFDDLHAFSADTGQELWRQNLAQVAFARPPVASGGVVYVYHGQGGGTVHAFRGRDGALLWRRSTVGGAGVPALGAERIYLAGACANAQALDRRDGAERWTHRTGCSGGGDVTPALHGGRLYVPDQEHTGSEWLDPPILSAADGSVVGRFRGARPVFVDGLAVHDTGEELRAVELASGRAAWTARRAYLPVAVGHDVYGIRESDSGARALVALDSETGQELWGERLPGDAFNAPSAELAVAPGLLLVASAGRVTAYESALKPDPRGIALGASGLDVEAGTTLRLVGVLGRELRGARPDVAIEVAPWRRSSFRRAATVRPARDGGFVAAGTALRNARYRASAAGAASGPLTVYVWPRVRLGRPRAAGRDVRLAASVRTPGVRLGGARLFLYLQRAGARRVTRLDGATLRRTGRGRTRAVLEFRPPRRVGHRDVLAVCVRGQLRRGLGRPSAFTRRCGARRLPAP